jgi:UDP-glucose 4-epimerase
MCEAILYDLASADLQWSIFALRYFNPIGCDASGMLGEDPRSIPSNLMPVVVKVMTGELPVLSIYGTDWDTRDGTPVRDYIHVTDLARGHLAALSTAPKFKGTGAGLQVFNLGSGMGHSVLDVVAAMEAVSGRRIPVQPKGRREGDVAVCIAEPAKAAAELGWRTERSLEDCCEDICRFLGINAAINAAIT